MSTDGGVEEVRPVPDGRRRDGWLVRPALVVMGVAVVIVGSVIATTGDGPVPSGSIMPALPDDIAVVANATEYSDAAGGIGVRALVLRSSSRSPVAVRTAVEEALAADESWHWRGEDQWLAFCVDDGERTGASVRVEGPGEIDLAQHERFTLDEESAVVHLTTWHASGACPH